MPHGARKRSESGYYHVVPKGAGGQIIFQDDADRRLYVQLLEETKQKTGILLHAYCLMSNHTHLVVEDPKGNLSDAMKCLDERYGTYFANKTGRSDGVFRRPYWSEPIESDAYLLCAVRYVHANPANAGICKASAYEWSSAKDYLGRKGIADTSMVLDMCGSRTGFIKFSQPKNSTLHPFPGSKLRRHESDSEAFVIARQILGFEPQELPRLPIEEQARAVDLLGKRGFTQPRISRITGLGRRTVSRFLSPRTQKGLPLSCT